MSVSKRLLVLMSALVVAVLVLAGCGSGGASSSSGGTLTLGELTGWPEDVAVDNLTKVVLEEDLGYKEVKIETLDVGLLFEGVGSGDLDAYMDVWLPNHKKLLAEVKNDVEHLEPPWYTGRTTFGLAVPDYMSDVKSIADLNQSGATEIIGIEPGAVISEQVPKHVIPEYNLKLEYKPSSTAAMLAEVQGLYQDKKPFVFPPWCPSTHCNKYEYHYLKDPKNAMGDLDYGPQSDTSASISGIVNEDLPDDDPVAYAWFNNLRLNEDELISLEQEIVAADDNAVKGVKAWLKDNRDVVQPAIDAAKKAQ
jgi:glycine betaine/proline transport system substrate-binding protein